ncbi:MAG: hypothetical protein J1F16_07360 [Muribaculaceae bacterium]|nr:hypothetical protein [Muribaculaceae bacterium]
MKLKKYHIITCIMAIYALFMTIYFGLDLLREGQTVRFWVTLIAESIVLVLAFFALRKRDEYRIRRKREIEEL